MNETDCGRTDIQSNTKEVIESVQTTYNQTERQFKNRNTITH